MSDVPVDRIVRAQYGPWPCPTCGAGSEASYRCTECGADLVGNGNAAATQSGGSSA